MLCCPGASEQERIYMHDGDGPVAYHLVLQQALQTLLALWGNIGFLCSLCCFVFKCSFCARIRLYAAIDASQMGHT